MAWFSGNFILSDLFSDLWSLTVRCYVAYPIVLLMRTVLKDLEVLKLMYMWLLAVWNVSYRFYIGWNFCHRAAGEFQ